MACVRRNIIPRDFEGTKKGLEAYRGSKSSHWHDEEFGNSLTDFGQEKPTLHKDFDQSRRVLLSSDLHSISVLKAQMETDTPDITNSCEERNRLSLEIEALDIVINRCTELVNFPDTDDNHKMKAILRASSDDTQRKRIQW
ncbi:hypothetical protein TNCV_2649911 [Trichonephila clavipes]|nr:hypothetical protein TNCV_2649911 [Trichonephila clavipes]